jgi:hypothetical protein
MKHLNVWLGGLGLALLFLALRWNNFNVPLVRDEGEYAYSAQLLRHGQAPYEHAFLQKPPMVAYSYALADVLAPRAFWFPRVLAYLFVALATVLLGLIAHFEFGPAVAWPSMWLVTPMILLPHIEQFTANTEMFMLLPLMALMALYALTRNTIGLGWAIWLSAGALAATTFWYKYTALPLLGLVFVAWSVRDWRANKNVRVLCGRWGFALLGATVASAAVLAFFLAHDGGKHLWECTVAFNRFYAASASFGMDGLWGYLRVFWTNWWILFLLLAGLALKPDARLWLWSGMFLSAWIATGASAHGHYYVVVMPFWALLASVGLHLLASFAAARFSWSAAWLSRGMTAAVVLLLCLPSLPWMTRSQPQFAADRLQWVSPFIESLPVARRVAELTSPQDYIFVAGSEPQILYYAQRFSPTRFIIAYPLMIPTPLAQGFQQEVIRDLDRHSPALVVLAVANTSWLVQNGSPPDLFKFIDPWLAKYYERIGGYVSDGQASHYAEPIPDTDLPKASLMLFKRKDGNMPGQRDRKF